jgi:uncharacterized damage-inducible protein DinB
MDKKEGIMTNNPELMTVEFLHYNLWANLTLIDACINLTSEQLDSTVPGTYGSIYDTFKHLVRAEAGYLRRLTRASEPLPSPFSWDDRPSLAEIRPYAEQVSSSLEEVARQTHFSDMIDHEWEGEQHRYKSVMLLIQVVNHGVEHRTNITTILAQHGIQAPDIDGWGYLMDNEDRLGE